MPGKKKTGPRPKLLTSAVITKRQRARLAAKRPAEALRAVVVAERDMGVDQARLGHTNVLPHQLQTLQRMRAHHNATHTYVEGEVICVFDPAMEPPMWMAVVRSIKISKGKQTNARGSAAADPAAADPAAADPAAADPGAADPAAADPAAADPGAADPAAADPAAASPVVAVAPVAAAAPAAVDPAAAKRALKAGYVRKFRLKGIDPADPSTHITRAGEQQPVIVYAYNGKLVHRACSVLYCATLQAVVAANFAEGEVAPLGRYDTPNPDGTHFKGELTLAQLANALLPPGSPDIDSQYTDEQIQELRDRVAGYVIWDHAAADAAVDEPASAPSSPHPSHPSHPSQADV